MNVIRSYFTLIRFTNGLTAMAAVAVGQYLGSAGEGFAVNPYTMAAAFFVCGFGNIINDILDLESDRVNHPRRALPSGAITVERAKTLAFIFLLISLVLLIKINGPGRLIVLAAIILVILYNLRLQHTPYWGNIAVALLGAMTFLLGGSVYGYAAMIALPGPSIPAVFALLMHGGREIIKDIEDRPGDELAHSRTAPVVSGAMRPLAVSSIVFAALIALSLAVYLNGWFNKIYLYIVMTSIYLPVPVQFIGLAIAPKRRNFRLVSSLIKIEMIIGLIALIVGRNY